MKKLIIFDLDGTLTASKAPLAPDMAEVLKKLLSRAMIAVISGGSYGQYQKQFLSYFNCPPELLPKLILVPTNGSVMYLFKNGEWQRIYAEVLTPEERKKIIDSLNEAFEKTHFEHPKTLYGPQIEDRETQITFSALGQEALVELKKQWDPERKKRLPLKEYLDKVIPEFEVRVNSSSSIDITRKGIDKAYGIYKLRDHLNVPISDMVFIGDALFPNGNDFAATTTGVETIAVKDEHETKKIVEEMLQQ